MLAALRGIAARALHGSSVMTRQPILHHVNLKTTRLEEMLAWYRDVVGLEPIFRNDIVAFTSNDEANHRLAFITSPKLRDDDDRRGHAGIHHIAFEYASVDDLLDTWQRLHREMKLTPHMSLDHGMTLSFYYLDPDGNSVELQADWFPTWAESKEWMRTSPDFRADPVGKFIEPAKLIAARAAGASTADLHRRAYAGEFPADTPPDMRFDR
jgi:catechol-2,3-dioxygenase